MSFSLANTRKRTPISKNRWLQAFTLALFAFWAYSFSQTTDLANWILENILVFLFIIFLLLTYKKHQLSDLSYFLILAYLCLHIYGSIHTYANAPLGFKLQEMFGWKRNHYDRIVHFSYGFLLAYSMREFFLRWLKAKTWVAWALPIEITLSTSGLYELVEWAVADLFFPEQGGAYLGTQGDMWDAQKDMFLATLGAIAATLLVIFFRKTFEVNEEINLDEL